MLVSDVIYRIFFTFKLVKAGTSTEGICFQLQKLVSSLVKYISGTLMNAVKVNSKEGFAKVKLKLLMYLIFICEDILAKDLDWVSSRQKYIFAEAFSMVNTK